MAIETNELIDVQTLPPFKKFIMSIGAIPTSYLESMSYAEMLAWFCNYLQNTVIPTVNNNGEAVEELQDLFVELKSYVDDYFENLDITNEINNKLDSMAEDGSLYSLIQRFVNPLIAEQNERIDEQNAQIDNINLKVNSAVNGSPLVATSTAGMTDTTRVYVNTSNGHWYWYDGDSWEDGGTYQSTGIGENSISSLNLDNILKTSLYIRKPSIETNSGYIAPNGSIQENAALNYTDLIKLNEDETIYVTASGGSSANGVSIISVFDESDNFLNEKVTNSNGNVKSLYTYKSKSNAIYVRISYLISNGLEYYISKSVKGSIENQNQKFNNITNTHDVTATFNNGYYIDGNSNIEPNTILSYTEPIELKNGETIIVKGAGIRTVVAMISTCDANKENVNRVVMSIDGEIREYSYTADRDTYVMISGTTLSLGKIYITSSLKENKYKNTLFTSFIKFGVIGDSLASGECVSNENGILHYNDLYEYSWGQFMARNHGMECINFSKGGLTTRSWLTESVGLTKLLNPDNKCNSYIIGLGTNDVTTLGVNYLGTIADVHVDDFTLNADTYYGNYARIIGYIKQVQPKAKIFVLTNPKPLTASDLYIQYNNAIKDIATLYNDVYVIDLQGDYLNNYTSGFINDNVREGHYNATSYNYMSELLFDILNDYMYNNYTEFEQIEFIGTNHIYS